MSELLKERREAWLSNSAHYRRWSTHRTAACVSRIQRDEVSNVDIGEVERVIQVEPLVLPVPEAVPMPEPIDAPARDPEPARTRASAP